MPARGSPRASLKRICNPEGRNSPHLLTLHVGAYFSDTTWLGHCPAPLQELQQKNPAVIAILPRAVSRHAAWPPCSLLLCTMFFKQQGTSCTTGQVSTRPSGRRGTCPVHLVETWPWRMEWPRVTRTLHRQNCFGGYF